mmetsp:Transcript_23952/g.23702  ORF Transcript_23952/g.23702 Transcript_23952/m.23702 type:complete len:323 (+) Transcript_23952:178-1146(+)
MRQHYMNGVQLRQRYIIDQSFLKPNYDSTEIYVRSTDVNRTIMSAESLLSGLYPNGPTISNANLQKAIPPIQIDDLSNIQAKLGNYALPTKYQPIPIHVVEMKYDTMLYAFGDSCPRFDQLYNDIPNTQAYQERVTEYINSGLQAQVNKIFNTNASYEDASNFGDTMVCELFDGFPLPEGVTNEIYMELIGMYNYTNTYYFTPEGAALSSTEFFEAIIQQFNMTILNETTVKLSLYSAHDTTLAGFLIFMNVWDGWNPLFASTLRFELYGENGGYFVSIQYNDKVLTLPGCVEMCPFDEFVNIIEPDLIKNMTLGCQKHKAQ